MAIATSPITYCNLTTDLIRAYQNIFDMLAPKQITGWTLVSGQTNTYQANNSGYVAGVWQDEVKLTSTTSIALTEATASRWYYDSTNDILYVHTSDNTDPDGNHTITAGVDRLNFLTECRAVAQGKFESMLDRKFPRPLPEARYGASYLGRKYDDDIITAVAKLTCAEVISSLNPESVADDDLAGRLRKEARDIVDAHNKGERAFNFEIVKPEVGTASIIPYSVSGDGMIEIYGDYSGASDKIMRVKIFLAGAIGTATYQYSTDDGTTYSGTSITTANTWVSLTEGLYIRFDDRGSTFSLNDTWKLYCTPKDKALTSPKIGNINMVA